MSTGKRLAKRSIIGTRVCAPGDDGKYYSGVISAVNTPTSPQQPELAGLSITPDTRYSVRFDPPPEGCEAPDSRNEYSDRDLIGPGFGSVTGAKLVAGQRVYLTYNGREIQAEVVQHREHLDEVDVVIAPSGQEGTMRLTKRIDEVRLLESRKSARLADSDTDFARLADMGSERKRAASHSIDVPQVMGSRKRRPSSSNDSDRSCNGLNDTSNPEKDNTFMDACSAAMVLMSLSTPPKDSVPFHCQNRYGDDRFNNNNNNNNPNQVFVVGSPGESHHAMGNGGYPMVIGGNGGNGGGPVNCSVNGMMVNGVNGNGHQMVSLLAEGVTSNSSSSCSSASWRSNTPSPPLSDEGPLSSASNGRCWPNNNSVSIHQHQHNRQYYQNARNSSTSPTNVVISDEGIVPDLSDNDRPRKKKIRCKADNDDYSSPNAGSSSDNEVKPMTIFKCTWRDESGKNGRCGEVGTSWEVVAEHVLRTHLNGKKTSDDEEDFYIVDEELEPACSPPTKSHWDMVRPRTEDPEYQKELRLAALPATQSSPQMAAAINTQDIIIRDVFSMASQNTPNKQPPQQQQFKQAARPLQAYNAPNISVVTVSLGKMPQSPSRRVRGETKKCRKIYGMHQKDLWCTQCKWKKACSRFSD